MAHDWDRICRRKARYATKIDAFTVRELRRAAGAPALRIYPCPHCYGWHLAKRRRRPRKAPAPSLSPARQLQDRREAEQAAEAVAAARAHGGRLVLIRPHWFGGPGARRPHVRSKAVRLAAARGMLEVIGYTVAVVTPSRP